MLFCWFYHQGQPWLWALLSCLVLTSQLTKVFEAARLLTRERRRDSPLALAAQQQLPAPARVDSVGGLQFPIVYQRQDVQAPRNVYHQVRPTTTTTTGNNATFAIKQQRAEQFNYGVVIDCGSSGSRVRIYQWPPEQQQGQSARHSPETIRSLMDQTTGEALNLRVRPGISTFSSNPDGASDYLRPLMEFASRHVPATRHKQTSVYIMATAGMRLLDERDQRAIWADIERDTKREFGAQFGAIRAEVISGAEEGAFQWLSANALANRLNENFDQQSTSPGWLWQAPSARRLAVLEMGGASAQVTYEVKAGGQLDSSIGASLKHWPAAWQAFQEARVVYALSSKQGFGRQIERKYSLFSTTFLGFGGDAARSLSVDLLVRDATRQLAARPLLVAPNSTLVLDDPCLNVGSHEILLKPIGIIYEQTRSIGFALNEHRQSGARDILQVVLRGRGQPAACRLLLMRLVGVARKERSTCEPARRKQGALASRCASAALIGTHFVPWAQLQFVGLGELFYTRSEIFHAHGALDGPLLLARATRLCSLTAEQLAREHEPKDEFGRKRNLLACFKATWVITWLSSVLRLPLEVPAAARFYDLSTLSKLGVRDEPLDWTLGALIARQFVASNFVATMA